MLIYFAYITDGQNAQLRGHWAYKHAFPDRSGTISITLTHHHPASAKLTIEDDGIGYDVEAKSSRHEVGLVTQLMQQVGGTINVSSSNGTLCVLEFSVPVGPANNTIATL